MVPRLAGIYVGWIALFLSSISLVVFESGTRTLTDITDYSFNYVEIVRIASVGIALMIVMLESDRIEGMKKGFDFLPKGLLGIMFLYSLVAMLSFTYSKYPILTIYKSGEILIAVYVAHLTLLYLRATRDSALMLVNFQYALRFTIILISWLGLILFQRNSILFTPWSALGFIIQGSLAGADSNFIGELSAILLLVCLSRMCQPVEVSKNRIYWILAIPLSITLILAQCRAAIFAFGAALVVLLLLHKRIKLVFVALFLIGIVCVVLPIEYITTNYMLRGHDISLFYTMSSRTTYWQYAWSIFLKSPIYGYGYSIGEKFIVGSVLRGNLSWNIHNSYIAILLDLGLIGLIPFVLGILGTWFYLIRFTLPLSKSPFWLDKRLKNLTIELIAVMIVITAISFKSSTLSSNTTDIGLLLTIMVHAESLRDYKKELIGY